jgi:sec-independent protein translocase protein TatB
MLDVGFSEILLTSAIALIVLGPEKLPKVARQVGNWVGRARAMARQLTEQLEREVSAEELLKQTKSTGPSKTDAAAGSAPAPFDTSYVPNTPPPVVTPPHASTPTPPSAAVYSPENAAAVPGSDWHPSPPEDKAANE